jgi:sRNA-binding protein
VERGDTKRVTRRDGCDFTRRATTKATRALASYTTCPEYRAKLLKGAARIDLDGSPAGAVTAGAARSTRTPEFRPPF